MFRQDLLSAEPQKKVIVVFCARVPLVHTVEPPPTTETLDGDRTLSEGRLSYETLRNTDGTPARVDEHHTLPSALLVQSESATAALALTNCWPVRASNQAENI